MFIKIDRKRLLKLIEEDQTKLTKGIDDERGNMKKIIEKLNKLNTNLIEFDPYIKDLLIREERIRMHEAKTGKKIQLQKIEELNSDEEDM